MKKNLYKLAKCAPDNSEKIEKSNERNFDKAIQSDSAKSGIKK